MSRKRTPQPQGADEWDMETLQALVDSYNPDTPDRFEIDTEMLQALADTPAGGGATDWSWAAQILATADPGDSEHE